MRIYPHLEGRRCLLDLRCSSDGQAGTSLPDQRNGSYEFAKENKMAVAGAIEYAVTGSVPSLRTDLDEIIERKRQLNDFDVLVVPDVSRFTRAGLKHGMHWEYMLDVEGIDIVFVANELPDGEDGDLIKPSYYFAARMWMKSLAYACTRGSMTALLEGRMAHCTVAPYGLDSLYLMDGKPQYITRLLPDGRQLKMHPDALGKVPTDEQMIATFPANPRKGSKNYVEHASNHHRKQKYEQVVLVPGAPDAVTAVLMMFRLKLQHGRGGFYIASELNGIGIPAPRGGLWNGSTVDNILRNKTYVGVGVANRKTRAIVNKRSKGTPTPRKVTTRDLAKRKTQAVEYRVKEDWVERKYDGLLEFLGPDLAPLARTFVDKELNRRENGHVPTKVFHDRHAESTFWLKYILREKTTQLPMSGFVTQSAGHRYRRYRISRAHHAPVRGSLMRRTVPADRLEQAVLGVVEQVLRQAPDLRQKIITATKREITARKKDNTERQDLIAQRDILHEEYSFLIRNLGKHGRDLSKQKMAHLESQLDFLETRIAAADAVAGAAIDPEEHADQIIKQLGDFRNLVRVLSPELLRRAMGALISKLDVDFETLDIDVELSLPSWALINSEALKAELCLAPNPRSKIGSQAQWRIGLILGTFRCTASPKPVCFTCLRTRKAA